MKTQCLELTLTVLSPLHIGSGAVLDPTQYVVRTDGFYRIDDRRFAATLTQDQQMALQAAFATNDLKRIWQAVSAAFDPAKHAAYSAAIAPPIHDKFADGLQHGETQLELHEYIKEHGTNHPIIPGSSLKGALRTAVLQSLLPTHKDAPELNRLTQEWGRSFTNKKGKKVSFPDTVDKHEPPLLEGILLNALSEDGRHFNIKRDPFQYLSVPDITLPVDCLEIVSVERIKHATGDAGGPAVLAEAIRPGTTSSFSISYDDAFLSRTTLSNIHALLDCANAFTCATLKKIVDQCTEPVQMRLLKNINNPGLLRLGGHIGRFAFALDLSSLNLKLPKPKTICFVQAQDGQHLPGLVSITPHKPAAKE